MVVQRLNFRFSECYSEPEVELLLENLSARGAKYTADVGPDYHLDIPRDLDFTPFYLTLRECESVAWVSAQTYPVIVLNTCGIEG